MSNLDRDLRDALAPLGGDPVADARRVLAALPPVPPPSQGRPDRGLPPIAWWLLGAGLALGLLGGLGLGAALDRGATPAAPGDPTPQVPEPPPKQPPDPWQGREHLLYLMAFGPVQVDEPGVGRQDLEPAAYEVAVGTLVRTNDESRVGVHVMATDARIRLDCASEARITPGEVELIRGRVWIDAGARAAETRVRTALATTIVAQAQAMVTRQGEGLAVVGMQRPVVVRSSRGETVQIPPGSEVALDPDRGFGPVQPVPFLGTATSWMTEMILLQQDDTELRSRVREMVQAYEAGEHRAAAEREIRKLGTRCLALLVTSVQERLSAEPDYARATAVLAADLVEYRTAGWMFPLLELEDEAVRLAAFRGLTRATGTDGGTDAGFWRDASVVRRRDAIAAWRLRLR